MFERELVDSLFVQRWSIVRTLMPQSIAEHTFLVTHYANDIAIEIGLRADLHLSLLQLCLWHDARDEILTGDLPGPNKRGLLDAIGPDAKEAWDGKLDEWAHRIFTNLSERSGGKCSPDDALVIHLILKTADWMEASVRMATEHQMGNRCATRHIGPNMVGATDTAKKLCEAYYNERLSDEIPLEPLTSGQAAYRDLVDAIEKAVFEAKEGQSLSPWITKEDASRTYHEPCVDNA